MTRAFLALLLACAVLLAGAPHAHAAGVDRDECPACTTSRPIAPPPVALDVAPAPAPAPLLAPAPPAPPVTGAPLGAIPGQSPPRS